MLQQMDPHGHTAEANFTLGGAHCLGLDEGMTTCPRSAASSVSSLPAQFAFPGGACGWEPTDAAFPTAPVTSPLPRSLRVCQG